MNAKYLLVVLSACLPVAAGAALPSTYDGPRNKFEMRQLETLKLFLFRDKGLQAELNFSRFEDLNPRQIYNDLSRGPEYVGNLFRSRSEKIMGSTPRQVVVAVGAVGYYCEAVVKFRGATLLYAALTACDGPYLTPLGKKQDTQCWNAKSDLRAPPCKEAKLLLPSAIEFRAWK